MRSTVTTCQRRVGVLFGWSFPAGGRRKVLCTVTGIAPLDIACDIIAQTWPPKVSIDKFVGFVFSGVAMNRCVVMLLQDVVAYLWVVWDIDSTVIKY